MTTTVINGDCLAELKNLADGSVDSVVTDPPYNLAFMGKQWDSLGTTYRAWCHQWASECLRVLKPGGHLLAFGGTRTYHRLTSGIEDAGFEIRDSLHWIYGSGFPKSRDISKAIDSEAGEKGTLGGPKSAAHAGWIERGRMRGDEGHEGYQRPWMKDSEAVDANARIYLPATDAAQQWSGWGTALKPAHEPIVLARKPLGAATVAANVTEHGCGGINVDGCRIGTGDNQATGRWPANILLTHSPDCADECATTCPVAELDRQSGTLKSGQFLPHHIDRGKKTGTFGAFTGRQLSRAFGGDSGGASRFFYCAKAPRKERPTVDGTTHPTVKPLALIRWLTRLVTPVGGIVLDPFAGSGTTGQACALEGFNSILIEREPSYIPLIEKRLADGG